MSRFKDKFRELLTNVPQLYAPNSAQTLLFDEVVKKLDKIPAKPKTPVPASTSKGGDTIEFLSDNSQNAKKTPLTPNKPEHYTRQAAKQTPSNNDDHGAENQH